MFMQGFLYGSGIAFVWYIIIVWLLLQGKTIGNKVFKILRNTTFYPFKEIHLSTPGKSHSRLDGL